MPCSKLNSRINLIWMGFLPSIHVVIYIRRSNFNCACIRGVFDGSSAGKGFQRLEDHFAPEPLFLGNDRFNLAVPDPLDIFLHIVEGDDLMLFPGPSPGLPESDSHGTSGGIDAGKDIEIRICLNLGFNYIQGQIGITLTSLEIEYFNTGIILREFFFYTLDPSFRLCWVGRPVQIIIEPLPFSRSPTTDPRWRPAL